MRKPPGIKCHSCAPSDWKQTPDLTGSYDLDAVITKNSNPDLRDRLANHLQGNDAYLISNGYNSYTGIVD